MKCGSTQEIQVDHVLPRSRYPRLKLSKHNVGILCKPCNLSKAAKIEPDYRPILTRWRYGMKKWIIGLLLAVVLAYLIRLAVIDVAYHPFESTVSSQILAEFLEIFWWVWTSLSQMISDLLDL